MCDLDKLSTFITNHPYFSVLPLAAALGAVALLADGIKGRRA